MDGDTARHIVQAVILYLFTQRIFYSSHSQRCVLAGILVYGSGIAGYLPVVSAQLEAVILLTPFAGVDALVMLQVKIFGWTACKPIGYQRDAVICVLCFLCAVFLDLSYQRAAGAIGQADGVFAAFFLDQHHALYGVAVLQRHILVENIRIGTQCGIGFSVILQQIEGHMGFGETFVLYIPVRILHREADFTGVYLLGAIQYRNNVVAQNRVVGFRQAGVGQLVHADWCCFVNDQTGSAENGEIALAVVGGEGIRALQTVQFQPAAFRGSGICLVGYGIMPGLPGFAIIHRLAVHGAAAAYLSGERCAVNCAGIDLLSNVVVTVGIIYQTDGVGAGDGVFFEPQETVRQGMSVPIQSFTSLCFAISTRIGLLIHPDCIARYNVVDQDVANGCIGGRIVCLDVPGTGCILQIQAMHGKWSGRDFEDSAHPGSIIQPVDSVPVKHSRIQFYTCCVSGGINAPGIHIYWPSR